MRPGAQRGTDGALSIWYIPSSYCVPVSASTAGGPGLRPGYIRPGGEREKPRSVCAGYRSDMPPWAARYAASGVCCVTVVTVAGGATSTRARQGRSGQGGKGALSPVGETSRQRAHRRECFERFEPRQCFTLDVHQESWSVSRRIVRIPVMTFRSPPVMTRFQRRRLLMSRIGAEIMTPSSNFLSDVFQSRSQKKFWWGRQ
ncbi:hypothetical protein B0I37DRAFT_186400 [Chaetomium sp. MPI-CAGE-AT-0009]|nr:hypothetical protein B0I37DRAFT_186400 [Chaetomium sp. MPI-CAGE-AT-0009]